MKFKRSLFLPFLLSILSSVSFAQSSQLNDLLDAATHGNAEFFILKSITHTKNPLSNQFLLLMEQGIITMDHLIKRKNKTGSASEKGPLFKIRPEHLSLLFPDPKNYVL